MFPKERTYLQNYDHLRILKNKEITMITDQAYGLVLNRAWYCLLPIYSIDLGAHAPKPIRSSAVCCLAYYPCCSK